MRQGGPLDPGAFPNTYPAFLGELKLYERLAPKSLMSHVIRRQLMEIVCFYQRGNN